MNALLLNDDEHCRMIEAERKRRERAGEKFDNRPSLAFWTTEVNLLAVIVDRLAALIESNSAKPRRVVPYARPKTAFDRLDREEQEMVHKKLVAGLLPPA